MDQIKKNLHYRIAIAIGIVAIVIGLIASVFSYFLAYNKEYKYANRVIDELVVAIGQTASISAYLDNHELASEVVQGMTASELVVAARLISKTNLNITAGDQDRLDSTQVRVYSLKAPFDNTQSVGTLSIAANTQAIELSARETALVNSISLASQSIVIGIFVFFLANRLLTNPITSIAQQLGQIQPGTDKRLQCPISHEEDEIGKLTQDVNYLLQTTEDNLKSERKLRETTEKLERKFRLLFEKASAGIVLIDHTNCLSTWNSAFESLINPVLESHSNISLSSDVTEFFENGQEFREFLNELRKGDLRQTVSYELRLRLSSREQEKWAHCMFSTISDEIDEIYIEGLIYDITDRVQREKGTQYEADHDALTGLLNRRAGEKILHASLAKTLSQDRVIALLMLDLDKFKPINDTYGHDAGDEVLITVSNRINHVLRENDVVIRWGGDEFVIGLIVKEDSNPVEVIARKILSSIIVPIELDDGKVCEVGASIGISLCPYHASNLESLIEYADQAMYSAKYEGHNSYKLYKED